MYRMTYSVIIGGNTIPLISSVSIKTSVDTLCDTAVVVIPATSFRKRLLTPTLIQEGQSVTICLGYDDENEVEFEGFVNKISDDDGAMRIECEDSIYLFRKTTMTDHEYNAPSVKSLLNIVVQEVNNQHGFDIADGKLTLNCDYDFKYDKFTFIGCSAYDVLKKIQDDAKPNIFVDENGVLNVIPQYVSMTDRVADYSFQRNIERQGLDLQWRDKSTRKLMVKVTGHGVGKNTSNKTVTAVKGETGGDTMELKIKGVTDKDSLQKIADDAYERRNYTGFEGCFQGWLIPFCRANDAVNLIDEDDSTRNGKYYVTSTEVEFGSGGGVRKVILGHKLK